MVMAKKSEKIIHDDQLGEIVLRKNPGSRRMSIRVHPSKGISVIVPYLVPYMAAEAFFRLNKSRIIAIVQKQKSKYGNVTAPDPELIEELRARAKAELPGRLKELADRYGFVYNRVTIKHNSTNWGSCSARNNINLNLNLMRLPQVLRDYVLLHELCHLRHHDHGEAFHLLLEHLCTDHVLKLSESGDLLAAEIARQAALSRLRFPFDRIFSREMKKYRLI
jgi:predicted metal-dependent hydrolase